jgi:hypothetical protein
MKSYTIKPDDASKLKLLAEIKTPCVIEETRARFATGAAFLKALTFLRRQGVRCEVEAL